MDNNFSLTSQFSLIYFAHIAFAHFPVLARRGGTVCRHVTWAVDPSLACRVSLNLCTKLLVNPDYVETRKRVLSVVPRRCAIFTLVSRPRVCQLSLQMRHVVSRIDLRTAL